ncbi:hypothetical protein CYMTET_23011 [Cymbomonas tetramitiformis]|uniref:Uncharacterized protein n=1 Tax=Cymbomonas tetramitiformis TaxID=36881 RepID=A0AAE0FYS4_9CHLO|nr:hypothetical protein CYMTET_23011 [Cymbomonas tetramitiformis]
MDQRGLLTNSLQTLSISEPTLKEYCAAFEPNATNLWTGTLKDLFSPDDACPLSTRFIDGAIATTLHISASHTGVTCSESWGKRFFPNGTVDPVIYDMLPDLVHAKVSFESKVPKDAPQRKFVDAGALDFSLTLGKVTFGSVERAVIKWNGMYDGKGGPWLDGNGKEFQVPPDACNNFWLYTSDATAVPKTN